MEKKIVLVVAVSGLHLLFTLMCMAYAEGCRFDCTVRYAMSWITLFPLGILIKYWTTWYWDIDPLAILMCLNSLFWGIALVATYYWLIKKRTNGIPGTRA